MINVVFRGRHCYVNLNVDNRINGEGVGYIFSAKYWESFTIDSKVRRKDDQSIDNALDVNYLLFVKHVKSHSHMLKDLQIMSKFRLSFEHECDHL